MQRRAAFTLVEMSIILVIVGLLVGGVTAGQSMIHASQLRSVTTEFQRYVTATQAFREKFNAIPGDMSNATSYWGRADTGATSGQCAAPATNTSTGTGTCNGNGNGMVNVNCLNGCCDTTCGNEVYRYWQQLANAGMIEGKYDGITSFPASRYPNSIWQVSSYGIYPGNAFQYALNYGNNRFDLSNAAGAPLLKPEDAWNIDNKLDDGMPATGNVVAQFWSQCSSSASFSDFTGTYNLQVSTLSCSMTFRNVF